jgi:ribosome-binding factor A
MSRRTDRIREAIRETVSTTVLFHLSDPRVRGVTVMRAEITPDLRHAKVYVSLMGDEKTRKLAFQGLLHARGFLQKQVGERLDIRFTPILEIVEDESVKKTLEVTKLLREVLPDESAEAEPPVAPIIGGENDSDDATDDDDDGDDAELEPEDAGGGPTRSADSEPSTFRGSTWSPLPPPGQRHDQVPPPKKNAGRRRRSGPSA